MPPLCILVVFLLNGVACPSPTRRTNPNSRVTPRLVEGDIAVPERHLATGQELSAFLANPPDLWPGGVVYYWIETVFNDEGVNNITQAFNQIMEAVPCIKFRNVGPDYHGAHLIYTSTGGPKCYSNVGRQDGGGQLVNLGSPGCTYVGVVLHKTLHALGAMHEHMRPDRDLFVSINYENIQPQATSNFAMVHSSSQSFGNTPFDTSSVMMYGPHDFGIIDSSGRPKITVQPLKAGVDMRETETKTELSLVDKIELARAYQPITDMNCFNCDIVARYAQHLDSLHPSRPTSSHLASDIELRTTGPAGEWKTRYMGVYQLHSESEGTGRVYKQRHDVDRDTQYYLYRVDQLWYVSRTIGMNAGDLVAVAVDSSQTTPPRKGWQYVIPSNSTHGSMWLHDPHMECGKPILRCKSVSVELSGKAYGAQGRVAGRYAAVAGSWSRGRPVFRQESYPHMYLFVATGELSWGIRATVGTTAQLWISGASAGTSCPSSPSVSVNKHRGLTSWRYFDFDLEVEGWQIWHDGAIEVRCSNCDDIVLYTENVDSLRSSNQSLRPPVPDLELRTSGAAAVETYHGMFMGVYQLHSEDEGQGRVYKQRHDDNGTYQSYLYRVGQSWHVSREIGLLDWTFLKADAGSSSQTTPPLKGWQFREVGTTTWNDDPDMECGKPQLPCMAVTVELAGEANDIKGECAGRYVVVDGLWSRGRQVWQQESSPHLYLNVEHARPTTWFIQTHVAARGAKIRSASTGTACPASPSNSVNKRLGWNSWQYGNSGWHDGNISVSCETPNRCL